LSQSLVSEKLEIVRLLDNLLEANTVMTISQDGKEICEVQVRHVNPHSAEFSISHVEFQVIEFNPDAGLDFDACNGLIKFKAYAGFVGQKLAIFNMPKEIEYNDSRTSQRIKNEHSHYISYALPDEIDYDSNHKKKLAHPYVEVSSFGCSLSIPEDLASNYRVDGNITLFEIGPYELKKPLQGKILYCYPSKGVDAKTKTRVGVKFKRPIEDTEYPMLSGECESQSA